MCDFFTGPPAPVTWAAMISRDKGTGNAGSVPTGAVPSKTPTIASTKPETKVDLSQAPLPQRTPRYVSKTDKSYCVGR